MQYKTVVLAAFCITGVLASPTVATRKEARENNDCIKSGRVCEVDNPSACCTKRCPPGDFGALARCSYLAAADDEGKEGIEVETSTLVKPMTATLFTTAINITQAKRDWPGECCVALSDGIVCGEDYCYTPPPPLAKKAKRIAKHNHCVPCGLQSLCWSCPSVTKETHKSIIKDTPRVTLTKKDETDVSDCVRSFQCGDLWYALPCSCSLTVHGELGEDDINGEGAQSGTDVRAGTCCIEDGIMMKCSVCPKQTLLPGPQATGAVEEQVIIPSITQSVSKAHTNTALRKKRRSEISVHQTTYDFQLDCNGLLTIQCHKCSNGGNHIDDTHCKNSCTCDELGGIHCTTPQRTQCAADETTNFCLHGNPYWACACTP